MTLITHLPTLPVAPVRGVEWVVRKVVEAAEEEYYDPTPVQQELAALERSLTAGEIDEETFERREDELLDRLEEVKRFRESKKT